MGDMGSYNNNGGGVFSGISDSISSVSNSVSNINVMSRGRDALNESTRVVSSAVSNVSVANTKDALMNSMNDNSSSLYLIIILLIISAIICYIIYYILNDNVLYQARVLIKGTEVPILGNELSTFSFTNTLEGGNGNRRSYCFWIYIFDMDVGSGEYRHIAHISSEKTNSINIKNASPYIILDSKSNKIHVRFAHEADTFNTYDTAFNHTNFDKFHNSGGNVCGFTINYIPIQRWVHVAFVLNDVGNGSVAVYLDGHYTDNPVEKGSAFNIHKLQLNHSGKLYVGGDSKVLNGFSGLLSKFTMFNHDLNSNDIFKEYNAGPLNGLMATMGMDAYGLRNPVYKIESSEVVV
jgi:hypothetical protein